MYEERSQFPSAVPVRRSASIARRSARSRDDDVQTDPRFPSRAVSLMERLYGKNSPPRTLIPAARSAAQDRGLNGGAQSRGRTVSQSGQTPGASMGFVLQRDKQAAGMGAEVALPVLLATVVFTAIGHDGLPQSSRW